MKTISSIIIVISIILTAGCAGDCIRVAGDYKGAGGSVEYCFKRDASKVAGVPVIEEKKEGETQGRELFGFDLEQIQDIIDKIRGKGEDDIKPTSTKALGATRFPPPPPGHIVKKLLKLIETKEE